MSAPHLFIFGFGYSAAALRQSLLGGWRVSGTRRAAKDAAALSALGVEGHVFGADGLARAEAELADVTHVLSSVPPVLGEDPVLAQLGPALQRAPLLRWTGYLSTSGVYGDAGGAWIDEDAPLRPSNPRGAARVKAEAGWQSLAAARGAACHLFRLPGIYGPGRSAFDALREGTARRIVKPGQVFSRVHVRDIAQGVRLALGHGGGIWNLCDDEPAPPQDVIAHAAVLLGIAPPPEEAFEDAAPRMSAMAREFYADCKRLSNARIKAALGFAPLYPSYREGLAEILKEPAA